MASGPWRTKIKTRRGVNTRPGPGGLCWQDLLDMHLACIEAMSDLMPLGHHLESLSLSLFLVYNFLVYNSAPLWQPAKLVAITTLLVLPMN